MGGGALDRKEWGLEPGVGSEEKQGLSTEICTPS